ncbi:MAG TPA: M1 family metallopeptidase [Gemmatimonadales bacterium]|nr:M1 family metallopeptidase [Gemmatimonadales bacterium]
MLALLLVLAGDTTGYWQQQVFYEITAGLEEPSGVLRGRARITYINRSPDTLRDFYVHQYLNAFRPGSRWAAADSAEGRVRFQGLADPDYAFERITASVVMGTALPPDYPYAPDSTIAHWTLPRPLPPGDTLVATIEWHARLSTLPRRQGRQGRRFDFAQWYPKVVVYDRLGWQAHPLYPAGEFYGEFATYDVTLDLPEDQVIGATGVPVEGDPGWERGKANPALVVDYQRDWYEGRGGGGPAGARCGAVGPGRKCVRFYAERVHHFAFSLNPEYRYEQGRYGDVLVRVLYLPEDRASWGNGIAVGRTVAALAWLDTLFGPFPWPQITNLHRIEGGGTEFPMVVMNGSASLGLIVHEVGHNYTMGILANNEWREGWLDEGFTSFQTGWFFESRGGPPAYPGLEARMLFWDLERWSEPVSTVSERFRDFATYNTMIYAKGQLFFEQLRYVVGDDVMRRILRAFYQRWRLKHVDEARFRAVAEEVSGRDLGWLFGQWLHATPLIDYALKRVERRRSADGSWLTAVTVERRGDGWMPLEIGDDRRVYARTTGEAEVERVEFRSDGRPGRLMLDPRVRGHDWNMLNNYERRGWWGRGGAGRTEWRVDHPARETARRDRLVRAVMPVGWSNDHGGLTLGLRARANYLGAYQRELGLATYGLRDGATRPAGISVRVADPVRTLRPRTRTAAAAWHVEGRTGVSLHAARSLRRTLASAWDPRAGFDAAWMATSDLGYLDRRLWDDAGTVEAGPWIATAGEWGRAEVRARLAARAGVVYRVPGPGIVSANRYDAEGFARVAGEASVRAPFVLGTRLGARVFAGVYLADSPPPRQRRIMVAGADPYETFSNPFLRSRGALLVRPDFHYHAPGGANLRGFRRDLGGRWAASLNLEAEKPLRRRDRGPVRRVALMGFADLGVVDSAALVSSPPGRRYTTLYDGGLGVVTRHVVGDLEWTVRIEFPLVVNRWDMAADRARDPGRLAFRWQVSLEPVF